MAGKNGSAYEDATTYGMPKRETESRLKQHTHLYNKAKKRSEAADKAFHANPSIKSVMKAHKASKKLAEGNLEFPGLANVPPHLELEKSKMTAKVTGKCEREWVAIEINELLVVEYYSRKV